MLEKVVEKKVCDYARKKGWLVYKFVSPSQRGVPDRLLAYRGHVLFIEFKQAGKKPTKLQLHHLDRLTDAGLDAVVIDNVETGIKLIDSITERHDG